MHPIVEFARSRLGVRLYDGQAAALSEYYESGASNWLLLAGRRSGKSLLSDVICAYEALVPDFSDYIRPGEDRYILIVSVRADNAALHIRNIGKLLKHDRAIKKMIVQELQDRIILSNNVVIQSMPASARAGRGFTCSTLLLDELAFFQDSLGNAAGDTVFDALSPTIATFGTAGRVIVTTSVSTRTGIVYSLFDQAQSGELTDFHVLKTDSRSLNPKVSQKVIDNATRRDPESAAAEYLSEFRDPVENFLDPDRIDAAVDRGLSEAFKAEHGKTYTMSIDPALLRDSFAFCVGHRDGEQYVIDHISAMHPPVDPTAADQRLFELAKRFKPAVIKCDNAALVMRLKPQLSALTYEPFTRPQKLRIYSSLKESFNLGLLRMYPHPEAAAELRALQIRNGNDISAPRSGKVQHDDLCDVLALVVEALASGKYHVSGPGWFPNPWEPDPDDVVQWELESGQEWQGFGGPSGKVNYIHKEGVTKENCKAKFCHACYVEWQEERDREAEYLKTKPPMSEAEFLEWQEKLHHPFMPPGDVIAEQRASRVVNQFWQTVKGRRNV